MVSEFKYIIAGDPISWRRPLAVKYHGKKMWDNQKDERLRVSITLDSQHSNRPLFVGPLAVTIIFYIHAPSQRRTAPKSIYHHKAPDLDNLTKFIFDAAKSILWEDDYIITTLFARKLYATDPHTEMIVMPLQELT